MASLDIRNNYTSKVSGGIEHEVETPTLLDDKEDSNRASMSK